MTWGLSAIGYASWALGVVDIPEWRLAILQDAQSQLRDGVIYSGGVFVAATMLGVVATVRVQFDSGHNLNVRSIIAVN